MKSLFVILVFYSLSFPGFSQSSLKNLLPLKGATVNAFVPKGWIRLHAVFGDYNGDGIKDVAIVIIDSIEEKIIGDANRSLVILKGAKNSYMLSSYCDNAILCYGCGGVHGDPYESILFEGSKLIVKHIVGSSYRVELTTRFRFQENQWVLIGETAKGCYLNAKCNGLKKFGGLYRYDKNYLTGEYIIKQTDELTCQITLSEAGKTKRQQLTKLSDYNISSVWNITK